MKEKINVLSLFDGISCAQIALERAGVKVANYYASEIDKYAIKVAQHNYPLTIQVGDVTQLKGRDLPQIDILVGGSPCQSFSNAGNGSGFQGKSGIFWEYVRLLEEIKPQYFLLENVVMKKEWEDVITAALGVEPIQINSRLVSGQNRVRNYWTNIPNVTLPEDKGIKFSEISEDGGFCAGMRGRRIDPITGKRGDNNNSIPYIQFVECRKDDKSNCLTTVAKDNVVVYALGPRKPIKEIDFRWLTPVEYERLQTLPDGYTSVVSNNQRRKLLGNGWTVDVVAHILSHL